MQNKRPNLPYYYSLSCPLIMADQHSNMSLLFAVKENTAKIENDNLFHENTNKMIFM